MAYLAKYSFLNLMSCATDLNDLNFESEINKVFV